MTPKLFLLHAVRFGLSYIISTEGRRAVKAIVNSGSAESDTGGEALDRYKAVQAKSSTTPQLLEILAESYEENNTKSWLN